jgi:hypothetical protein
MIPHSLWTSKKGKIVSANMVHCYIDESGNTGGNLFDPTQPHFYSGALIANFDFDAKHPLVMQNIARACGQEDFHANAIGLERLRPHLAGVQSLIKRENLRFYIGRVEKRHLALAKFFDVFFDPAENRAAPWHIYNSIQMRFLLLFNLNPIVSDGCVIGTAKALLLVAVDFRQSAIP